MTLDVLPASTVRPAGNDRTRNNKRVREKAESHRINMSRQHLAVTNLTLSLRVSSRKISLSAGKTHDSTAFHPEYHKPAKPFSAI
jgi:hypothetical protein